MAAKEDFEISPFTLFEGQELYNSLSINQESAGSSKRNYFTYTNDDSVSHGDDFQIKKLGRKITLDNDEEKTKRKEQNRAAQRAFRERKERYVKELEKKFKQFENKHTVSVEFLLQENQHLRSVISRLEIENCVLKGTPADAVQDVAKALENARVSLPVPPPPSLEKFRLPIKLPLPPLQIRPSHMQNEPQKVHQSKKREDQRFTFSVSTPDTLNAKSKIQPVKLYSDQPKLQKDSVLDEENQAEINTFVDFNNDKDFDDFLKPFLATHDDVSTNGTIGRTITTPDKKLNERYQQPSSKIWQRVSEHASNPKFSVDQLLNAVKQSTALTNERIVLDEWDMEQMLDDF